MNVLQMHQRRTLAHVLVDLREAREDYECAMADLGAAFTGTLGEVDADDRATEADARTDALRDEFEREFQATTGLTWKQIETAIQEAVL